MRVVRFLRSQMSLESDFFKKRNFEIRERFVFLRRWSGAGIENKDTLVDLLQAHPLALDPVDIDSWFVLRVVFKFFVQFSFSYPSGFPTFV